MKKIIAILAVCFLFASLLIPLVSASYVCPGAYSDTSAIVYSSIGSTHPSAYTQRSMQGTAFTANATAYLYNATFWMYRAGATGDSFRAVLYAASGTVGTNAYPSGSALATSALVYDTEIQGTVLPITFIFTGTYSITNANNYFIGVECVDDDGQGSNMAWKEGTAALNGARYYESSWHMDTKDFLFIVNGDSTEGAYETPTPTPAPTAGTGDADIENLTAIILPWLVPLLICLIPALLGYKFVGELGFFIGLNVGVILAYVTLAGTAYAFPLWGIILVGVMDVAVVLMRR